MKQVLGAFKPVFGALLLAVLVTSSANAQFRTERAEEPRLNTREAMGSTGDSWFSRIFDPARLSMHQTYSMSFNSSGYGSYGLSMFTNTFQYMASDDLFISADVSAVYSPFNSFGDAFSKQVNGIYLTSARLDYKLGDNSFMRIEYSGGPNQGYYDSPFSSPFARGPLSSPNPFSTTGNPGSPVIERH
jgi:hypothetical protein